MPGRKTDVSDAQWLQRLHSFGLLRVGFRPKGQIAELQAYVRQRERLLEYAERAVFDVLFSRRIIIDIYTAMFLGLTLLWPDATQTSLHDRS